MDIKNKIFEDFEDNFDIKRCIDELNAVKDIGIIEFSDEFEKIFNANELYNDFYKGALVRKFYLYYLFLISENKKYNLTALKSRSDILIKHFADCAFLPNFFTLSKDTPVLDIGTGAGFPGTPLNILNESRINYLDSSEKKIHFVKMLTCLLKYTDFIDFSGSNIKLIDFSDEVNIKDEKFHKAMLEKNLSEHSFLNLRAEETGKLPEYRETYKTIVTRAVAGLNILCEYCAPLLEVGGIFYSMKGRNADEELAASRRAIQLLGLEVMEIKKYFLHTEAKRVSPEGDDIAGERCIIALRKIKKTSTIYPRNFSIISKNPL